mmetsp:Transcript_4957/g.15704  ORF Transcript_4957/g.15704 Transcript_4957/m.15704 type:complete len:251 (-) Transcript_4957:860-1612(-)
MHLDVVVPRGRAPAPGPRVRCPSGRGRSLRPPSRRVLRGPSGGATSCVSVKAAGDARRRRGPLFDAARPRRARRAGGGSQATGAGGRRTTRTGREPERWTSRASCATRGGQPRGLAHELPRGAASSGQPREPWALVEPRVRPRESAARGSFAAWRPSSESSFLETAARAERAGPLLSGQRSRAQAAVREPPGPVAPRQPEREPRWFQLRTRASSGKAATAAPPSCAPSAASSFSFSCRCRGSRWSTTRAA